MLASGVFRSWETAMMKRERVAVSSRTRRRMSSKERVREAIRSLPLAVSSKSRSPSLMRRVPSSRRAMDTLIERMMSMDIRVMNASTESRAIMGMNRCHDARGGSFTRMPTATE